MRWLVDGYNVIRRSPELRSREQESLEAGRRALCALLTSAARVSGDTFTIVFDGAGGGGRASGGPGIAVVFSSARESADRVLVRLAREGGAVVSNDREVRQGAARAGAIAIGTDEFLHRLETARTGAVAPLPSVDEQAEPEDAEPARGPRKGNPRKLSKKARAARRALGRLGPS
jgi:predicted RNA-binding protein with PIN domain